MNAVTRRVVTLTVGLMLVGAVSASAEPRRRIVVVPRVEAYRPFVHGPFWRPWYPYGYDYRYYGLPAADLRTEVTPKDAEVFVDGYFAGRAHEFDGAFHQLHVVPGGHEITLHRDGFRTVTDDIYVRPDSTFKMHTKMERLAAGQTSAPVPNPQPAPTH